MGPPHSGLFASKMNYNFVCYFIYNKLEIVVGGLLRMPVTADQIEGFRHG